MNLCSCRLISSSAESLAEALTTNKHLQVLDISNNPLCDDGIQYLARALGVNQGLKVLSLQNCSLTSMSADSLAGALITNTHLEVLTMSNNPLCNDGIQHLAHALRVNQGLKSMNLQRCNLSSLSESFAEALATNKQLEILNISNNALCDDGIQHLAHALRVNQGLIN